MSFLLKPNYYKLSHMIHSSYAEVLNPKVLEDRTSREVTMARWVDKGKAVIQKVGQVSLQKGALEAPSLCRSKSKGHVKDTESR